MRVLAALAVLTSYEMSSLPKHSPVEMSEKSTRRNWTKEETMCFLQTYAVRKSEFTDIRRKKHAMGNVLEDLISQGILTEPTTVEMLQVKLKNLIRAFKASKDNANRTGASPCFAPFEEIMEEIFGDLPVISNSHTAHLAGEPITALPMANVSESGPEMEFVDADVPSSSSSSVTPVKTPKLSLRQKYLNEKLELKKKIHEDKMEVVHELKRAKLTSTAEAKEAKKKMHEEKMEVLREILKNRREANP